MSIKLSAADCQIAYVPETTKVAASFLASHFPSLAAAVDAYNMSRLQQRQIAAYKNLMRAQRDAQLYPALHSTQPDMWMAQQQAASGGGYDQGGAQQPVHHRRHRHHSG